MERAGQMGELWAADPVKLTGEDLEMRMRFGKLGSRYDKEGNRMVSVGGAMQDVTYVSGPTPTPMATIPTVAANMNSVPLISAISAPLERQPRETTLALVATGQENSSVVTEQSGGLRGGSSSSSSGPPTSSVAATGSRLTNDERIGHILTRKCRFPGLYSLGGHKVVP